MSMDELKKSVVLPLARRFFAGETMDDALDRVKKVNSLGLGATLDFLGEDISSVQEAEAATAEYGRLVDAVSELRLDSSVAVKLTHIGLDIDYGTALDNALLLAATARERGVMLWVDMEGSAHTGDTIDIYRKLRKVHRRAGIALQACLHRTWDDLRQLAAEGAHIRLVKGAYNEPPDIAEDDAGRVRERFLRMMEYLFSGSAPFAIGTHDRAIIDQALAMTGANGPEPEFQMLMGIRDETKKVLAARGKRVVEYIPYGKDWYGYGMRRLMEKKRNVAYFAGGLFGR